MKFTQRISKLQALATLVLLLGGACTASAQTLVQIPFVSSYAGLAAGSGATLCSNDIPTFTSPTPMHVGDGCLPTQAMFSTPSSVALDAYNNIYISDYGHKLLRVIYEGNPTLAAAIIAANPGATGLVPQPGHIYTIAGGTQAPISRTGSPTQYYCNLAGNGTIGLGNNGDGCPGSQSYVQPRGISVDQNGNVFFANLGGGSGMRVFYVGGTAVAKLITLLNPTATSPQVGSVYSITGSSTAGYSGDGKNARTAQFENVRDVVVDPSGNLYISDGNSATSTTNSNVRRIDAVSGIITTIAGSTSGPAPACPAGGMYGGDGGPAAQAALNSPYAMFMDRSGNLYIADSCNGRLRVIYAGGTLPGVASPVVGDIYTVAGGGTSTGAVSGIAATQLSIALLQSAGIDAAGYLYVEDATNKYVWQINPNTGTAILIGGIGTATAPAAGAYCSSTAGPKSVDNQGDGCPATQASISSSLRFAADTLNHLYSVESGAATLRQYSLQNQFPSSNAGTPVVQALAFQSVQPAAPTISTQTLTLQGGSTTEFADAGGDTCTLPVTLTAGQLCVFNVAFSPAQAGLRSGSLQLSNTSGALTTAYLSGIGNAAEISLDPSTQSILGTGVTAEGVGTDLLGNLYIADGANNQVVRVPAAGGASTTLITGLKQPHQVALDGLGNIYVADTGNNRIVKTPVSGSPIAPLGAGLSSPQGVAVDGLGNVYAADTGNNRVVEIFVGGQQMTLPLTGLSNPTQIAIDAAGDIYVADTGNHRVVELPVNSPQVIINLGSTAITPVGIAIDAAGDLYIADSASLQVIEIAAGTTNSNMLATSLKVPAGLAVDTNGSVYVADAQASGVIALNRNAGSLSFPLTNVGESSQSTIRVSNSGNASLTFPGPQLASLTGNTANFSVASASLNGCTTTASLAPANSCSLATSFMPTATVAVSAIATFNTNAANNATASELLSGTGANLISTSSSIVVTSPAFSTIPFGTPAVVTATVTASGGGAPAGTIILSVDGKAQAAVPFGTGTTSLSLNLPVGLHAVSVTFSGDTVYASSGSSVSFTVVKAPTMTALTLTPSAAGGSPTLTFTATVASPSASSQTGMVSFYSGTTLLNTSSVAVNGTATYITQTLTYGSNSFTAVYSGDNNFVSSTSNPVQPAGDFALTSSGTVLAIAQGGVASTAITVTPLFNMNGTVTPTCSNLPANTICRFQPTTVSLSGNAPVGVSIQIYTNVSSTLASTTPRDTSFIAFAFCGPWGIGLVFFLRRRRGAGLPVAVFLLLAFVSLGAVSTLTGCSGTAPTQSVTPSGSQAITISFVGSGATTVTHSLSFNFTVNTP
jgi:sugar lactone lactonase YvrE